MKLSEEDKEKIVEIINTKKIEQMAAAYVQVRKQLNRALDYLRDNEFQTGICRECGGYGSHIPNCKVHIILNDYI